MVKLSNTTFLGSHLEAPIMLLTHWVRHTDPENFASVAKEVCKLAKYKKGRYVFFQDRITIEFPYREKMNDGEDHVLHLSFTFEFSDPAMIDFMYSNAQSYCQLMEEKNNIEWAKLLANTILPVAKPYESSLFDAEKVICFGPFIPGSLVFKETRDYGDCLMFDHSFIEFAPGINGATSDIYYYIKKIKNNEPLH